jgi:hypothetical protein
MNSYPLFPHLLPYMHEIQYLRCTPNSVSHECHENRRKEGHSLCGRKRSYIHACTVEPSCI